MHQKLVVSLVATIALIMVGCGGGSGPELGTVRGKVTLGGKPLEGALVGFYPADGRPSFGTTDGEGEYVLQFTSDQPGALIGEHIVRITTAISEGEGEETTASKEQVPSEYNDDSQLLRQVLPGDNELNFDIE